MCCELFFELGGFDEVLMCWDDVDICLWVVQVGYLNVWMLCVWLLFDVFVMMVVSVEEEDVLYVCWLLLLVCDFVYNLGFLLQVEGGFKLVDLQLVWCLLQGWWFLFIVLVYFVDLFGCGYYWVIQLFSVLCELVFIDGVLLIGLMYVVDLECYDLDVLVLQCQVGEECFEVMWWMQVFLWVFKVYELDDYLFNVFFKSVYCQYLLKDILCMLCCGLGYVDCFVVLMLVLVEVFVGFYLDIWVIENCLLVGWWQGLWVQWWCGEWLCVGWVGGLSYIGDLELIVDVVWELVDEVDWVFFGMCLLFICFFVREVYVGVFIECYLWVLVVFDFDLVLVLVEQNLFNECKSNLCLLEYGVCGFLVVCSDVCCYQDDLLVMWVKNCFCDWVEVICMYICDLDVVVRVGDNLCEWVLVDWMFDGECLCVWYCVWMLD